jgi:hypothetical protein
MLMSAEIPMLMQRRIRREERKGKEAGLKRGWVSAGWALGQASDGGEGGEEG